ncbi:MAG: hypothetical protein QGG40_20795, partial [Myxococcota bacterium]|nr:hypothetical protein [Myxococcota bacterium]
MEPRPPNQVEVPWRRIATIVVTVAVLLWAVPIVVGQLVRDDLPATQGPDHRAVDPQAVDTFLSH